LYRTMIILKMGMLDGRMLCLSLLLLVLCRSGMFVLSLEILCLLVVRSLCCMLMMECYLLCIVHCLVCLSVLQIFDDLKYLLILFVHILVRYMVI